MCVCVMYVCGVCHVYMCGMCMVCMCMVYAICVLCIHVSMGTYTPMHMHEEARTGHALSLFALHLEIYLSM